MRLNSLTQRHARFGSYLDENRATRRNETCGRPAVDPDFVTDNARYRAASKDWTFGALTSAKGMYQQQWNLKHCAVYGLCRCRMGGTAHDLIGGVFDV
jgi:hypothetical protein